MKKISLIACAALVAGLLVSCSNDAGTVDYNSVRYTSVDNSYVVSGTITKVTETASSEFGATDQTSGSTRKITETYTIKSADGYVKYGTDSLYDSNFQNYEIRFADSTGWYSKKNEGTSYSTSTKKYETVDYTSQDVEKGTGDPDTTVDGDSFSVYSVDGVLYLSSNGTAWEVTSEEDAFAEGESFSFKVTYTTSDHGYDYTSTAADGKQTGKNTSSGKTTYTYDLKFTAK